MSTHPSIEFLTKFHPSTAWCLSACTPDREKMETRSFTDAAQALRWIEAWNGERNIYFHVNPARDAAARKKLSKEDIAAVAWLHVDMDPPNGGPSDPAWRSEALGRIKDFAVPPTAVVFSGNGFGVFWKLEAPIILDGSTEAADAAGLFNRKLSETFGGDNCHNIDRLMRLPGTMNLPGERKTAKGRVPVRAELVLFNDNVHPISAFSKAKPVQQKTCAGELGYNDDAKAVAVDNLNQLDQWGGVPPAIKEMIVTGRGAPKAGDDSRSAHLFDAICGLMRHGVPDAYILGLITDTGWKISESVLDKKGGAEKYAQRQIENARKFVGDEKRTRGASPEGSAVGEDFARNDNGAIYKTARNVEIGIRKLGGVPYFNLLSRRAVIDGFPGDQGSTNNADRYVRVEMDKRFHFTPAKDLIRDVIEQMAHSNPRHPVQEYLSSLTWDKTERLPTMLATLFGAEDNAVTAVIGTKWMISAVARAMQPGCKVDYMLILEGPQGIKKSTALEKLFGQTWVNASHCRIDDKDAMQTLRGKWLRIIEECDSFSKKDTSDVKQFITATQDTYRASYARESEDNLRQNVFAGTTNKEHYLTDDTGNRRFWPVTCTTIDIERTLEFRDQLWAEAAARYNAGEKWWLEDAAIEKQLQADQEIRSVIESSVMKERIASLIAGRTGKIKTVTIIDALRTAGQGDEVRNTRSAQMEIAQALRALGWRKCKSNGLIHYSNGEGPMLEGSDLGPQESKNRHF